MSEESPSHQMPSEDLFERRCNMLYCTFVNQGGQWEVPNRRLCCNILGGFRHILLASFQFLCEAFLDFYLLIGTSRFLLEVHDCFGKNEIVGEFELMAIVLRREKLILGNDILNRLILQF